MLGAIIGDVVGSIYKCNNIKHKNFRFYKTSCFFTDATVMTAAVAEAVMLGGTEDNFINAMKMYGRFYPDAGYGEHFARWVCSADRKPYGSYGNGSAMRVSPVGELMSCEYLKKTGCMDPRGRKLAKRSAAVTHNHPEGIKGALAVADAICICRYCMRPYDYDMRGQIEERNIGECKRWVKEYISEEYGYDLSPSLDDIRPTYKFDETCQGTVPQAIIAFLESEDFRDAICNAVSLGGESDTLAAITGSIAEAAYEIPQYITRRIAYSVDGRLSAVYRRWRKYVKEMRNEGMTL